jgi:hypothetical protein
MGAAVGLFLMQEIIEKEQETCPVLLDLSPEDKRKLIGFFELLIKVDKRINPALYELKTQQND